MWSRNRGGKWWCLGSCGTNRLSALAKWIFSIWAEIVSADHLLWKKKCSFLSVNLDYVVAKNEWLFEGDIAVLIWVLRTEWWVLEAKKSVGESNRRHLRLTSEEPATEIPDGCCPTHCIFKGLYSSICSDQTLESSSTRYPISPAKSD